MNGSARGEGEGESQRRARGPEEKNTYTNYYTIMSPMYIYIYVHLPGIALGKGPQGLAYGNQSTSQQPRAMAMANSEYLCRTG